VTGRLPCSVPSCPGPACAGRGRAPSPVPTPQGDSHHGPLPGASPGKNQFLAGSRWPILPGFSGNRRQHHPLARLSTGYRHDCPRPRKGAGEERVARAGWGDGGERSMGDKTKVRYGLLFWNRCTSGLFHLNLRVLMRGERSPPHAKTRRTRRGLCRPATELRGFAPFA
jgi:hypothetical protein